MRPTDLLRPVLLAGLTFILPFAQAEQTISHAQGTTAVPEPIETVLTFDIATLDTLDTLGVDVDGLPQDSVPARLDHYRGPDYTNIGSLFEPDYETVATQQADLVIVAGRSSTAYDDLSRMAPTIDLTVDSANHLNQARDAVTTLGQLFHKEAAAAQHLETLEKKVDEARTLAADAGEALVIMTNGGNLTAYGPGSRFGWVHDELDLASAATDLEQASHGDPISFEYLLERDPEYLFVIDRDGAIDPANQAARATLDNDLVKRTQAYENDRIIYLDSVNWYIVGSGLTALHQMMDELIAGLSR